MRLGAPTVPDLALLFCAHNNCKCFVMTKLTSVIHVLLVHMFHESHVSRVPWFLLPQDVKLFRFYKDLINFQGRGDPSLMLKCINPAEVRERGEKGGREGGREEGGGE